MVCRTHDNVCGEMLLGFRVQGLFGLGLASRVRGFDFNGFVKGYP